MQDNPKPRSGVGTSPLPTRLEVRQAIDDAFAEAQDAIENIQGALRHYQQPQDVTFHRALKAIRDGRALLAKKQLIGALYTRSRPTDGVASVVTRPLPTIPGDIVERLDDIIKWVDGNRACIWKDEDVADLRAAKAEIERLHARVAHLDADVTGFSFQHTLDQEEIERLRNSFLVKTPEEQETLKRIAWGEGYAVGCLAKKALREALEMAKRLCNNINEFGHVTDCEFYDAAYDAIDAALASPSTEGWRPITDADVGKTMLVTNNIKARDAFGEMSHRWLTWIQAADDPKVTGKYVGFDCADRLLHDLTHCAPIPVPEQEGHAAGLPEPKASTS